MRHAPVQAVRRVLLLAAVSLFALPATPQQSRLPYMVEPDELARFATGLRAAVEAQSAARVARFVRFPLRVNQAGRQPRFLGADGVCPDQRCATIAPRITTVDLHEP